MRSLFTLGACLFIFFSSSVNANAQIDGATIKTIRENGITLSARPEFPKPGETVVVSLSATSVDLDSATITWFVNERVIVKGIGEKQVSISAPSAGTITSVRVSISSGGFIYEKSTTVNGAGVSLIWEARSYVPPLFYGKALPTRGSFIVLQAIPHFKSGGVSVSPQNLVFTWKQDGAVIQNRSGYGKDSFNFMNDSFKDTTTIEVSAKTLDDRFTASDSITITRQNPRIGLYRFSLLYGSLLQEEESNQNLVGEREIGIRAVPWYSPINPSFRFQVPNLNWMVGKTSASNNGLTYLMIENRNGTANTGTVSVSIKEPKHFGEDKVSSVNLQFE